MSASRRRDVEPATPVAAVGRRPRAQAVAGAFEVLGDAGRVAADGVDVGRGQLDQALEQRALGRVGGAHPGRLEQLVGLEEVAALRSLEAGAIGGRRSVGGSGR